jgi:hypothetical protein
MKRRIHSSSQGQALIEFVLGLLVIFSFFFFFIRMCAIFAVANYIHYATFMAARAYSSASGNNADREERASEVLDRTVKGKFKSLIRAEAETVGRGDLYDDTENFWNQGVSYPFKAKLSLHPFTPKSNAIVMDLVSESWMPTNPGLDEVKKEKDSIKASLQAGGVSNVAVWWDHE